MSPRPERPWRPATCAVFPVTKTAREVSVTNQRTGERQRNPKVRFDARYRVDGFDFRKTFDQKGWAEAFANELKTGYAQGWRFDTVSRRFLDPSADEDPSPLTLIDHLTDYLQRRWPNWQPATRRNNQLELVRAALHLLRDGAPTLAPGDLQAADAYLRRAVLVVPVAAEAREDDERWRAWFEHWSRPLSEVTDRHLQDFLDHIRTVGPNGAGRELAASSIARTSRDTATLLFGSATGKTLRLSNFHRDVWKPVKATTFAEGDPLHAARLHDLRHAAISTWLNAGVPLKTAQTWSGHKTLSVLPGHLPRCHAG